MMNECRECGRPLNDPLSQQLGVGPRCFTYNPRRYASELVDGIQNNRWMVATRIPRLGTAASWTTALREAGFEAHYRAREDDGPYHIYVRKQEDGTG